MRKKLSAMLVVVFLLTVVSFSLILPIIGSSVQPVGEESRGARAPAVVDWWPKFHHDLALSGYSTSTAPNTNTTLWIYDTGSPVYSSPAIVDGILYIGGSDGKLYALDAYNGALKWTYATMGSIISSPAVAGGKVYFGSGDGKIYALSAGAGGGGLIWSVDIGGSGWSSPAVHGGNVSIGSENGTVFSLDAGTGAKVWSKDIGGESNGPIAVVNGKVYSGTHNFDATNATLVALDELTGAIIWTYNHTAWVPTEVGMINSNGVAVVDGDSDGDLEVYFGIVVWGGVGKAIALDETTGTLIWMYTFLPITGAGPEPKGPGWSTSTPAVHDGKVYIGSDDQNIYALNATDGTKIWNYTTKATVWSAPAVADGKVFVGSNDHIFYALDETTGALIWSYNTSLSRIQGSCGVAGGKVFVGNENGKVYAFGPPPQDLELYPREVVDLEDPTGTQWHELHPDKSRHYNLTSWEPGMVLSPCDYVEMEPVEPPGSLEPFDVDEVTIDIVVMDEYETLHWLDYQCGYWTFDPEKPVSTKWNEIKPDPGVSWHLTGWEDDGDGKLGYCDWINMTLMFPWGPPTVMWFHVENVTVTLKLESMLDLTRRYLEFMGDLDEFQVMDYIHDPISTMWHEIWPEQGRTWHLFDWLDSSMFSPSDQIVLTLKDEFGEPIPGSEAEYHVDKLTVAMNLTSMLDYEEHIVKFEGSLEQFKFHHWTFPWDTQWHEVNPNYSRQWHLWEWFDTDGNGILDFCDEIWMIDKETGWIEDFHVESLSTDIIITRARHDVAVTSVTPSKTVVGQGYSLSINVTVENQGNFTETFNVTAYANTTIIETKTITLTSGDSTTVTLTWNTTGFAYGNYTLSAVADTVPSEIDTADNTLTNGDVMVTIAGDVNGDRTVDIFDVGYISAHWYPGPPIGPLGYHPNANINCDGVVDIFDVEIASAHWGQTW